MSSVIPIVSSSPPPDDDGEFGWDDDDDDFGGFASAPSSGLKQADVLNSVDEGYSFKRENIYMKIIFIL